MQISVIFRKRSLKSQQFQIIQMKNNFLVKKMEGQHQDRDSCTGKMALWFK